MSIIKGMLPYLYALACIGDSMYYINKDLSSEFGQGYPTQRGKLKKYINNASEKVY